MTEELPWSPTPGEPANVERIRRRAHAVLEGRAPSGPPRVELALVVVFSVALLGWAVAAVV